MRPDPLVQLTADIARHGWHVLMIPEDDEGPAFAYTVGLTETFGHPEVLMAGLPINTLHALLNELGDRVRAQALLQDGDLVHDLLDGGYRCALRAVHLSHLAEYAGQAVRYYGGDDFKLLQCFWPDAADRLPWDVEFDQALRNAQPRLDLPTDEHPVTR